MTPTHLYILTGASRGMGRAMAEQLLHANHRLLCLSRRVDDTLTQAAQAAGCLLEQWSQDLSQTQDSATRLGQWLEALDPAPIASVTLINNAGVLPHIAPLHTLDAGELAQALRIDLEAPMLLSAAFLRATAHWPVPRKLLNISSGLGRRPMASQAAYCAAKAGMDLYTRCVALEQAAVPNGARVCALAPGVIDTDMQVQMRGANAADFPDRARFVNLHTQAQLSTPAQAAAQVLAYLARPDFGAEPVADVRQAG